MKRLKAFITALGIFLILSVSIQQFVISTDYPRNENFKYWYSPYKDKSAQALESNLDKDTMLIFGSSELGHEKNSKYYVRNMFHKNDLNAMIIGQPYTQDLNHTTTLAALAPKLKNKKVILLLSPTWFMGRDVDPGNFSMRFSDSEYVAMLKNPDLSKSLKEKIAKRTLYLLRSDKKAAARVRAYNRVYLYGSSRMSDRLLARYYKNHTEVQERAALFFAEKFQKDPLDLVTDGITKQGLANDPAWNGKPTVPAGQTPDWSNLKKTAINSSAGHSNNPLNMRDKNWNRTFKDRYENKKSRELHKFTSTDDSKEYGDLELFLQVCQQENIKPLLVIQPVNGYWFDHTGMGPEKRDAYRQCIKDTAEEYGVQVKDLSKYDYEMGVLSDAVHPWAKGWVILDEIFYNYYKAD